MDFLGQILWREGMRPNPKKLQAIKDWNRPIMVKEFWSFLGLTSFYIKVTKGFSQIMKPLLNLLKKKKSFEWQRSNKGHLKTWKISFCPPLCWNFQTSPNCLKSTLMWMISLLGESSCRKDTRLPLKAKTLWGTITMANSWKGIVCPTMLLENVATLLADA